MSQQPTPRLDTRGAVDLSSLNRPAAPTGPSSDSAEVFDPAAGLPTSVVVDVTEATFADLVQLSTQIPVVIDLWATWCEPCKQLSPALERVTQAAGGRVLLAKIDVDANPQIAQAFQVQSVPSVVALVKGQPVPLFQGAVPEPQIREVFTELLQVAEANGVTGRLPVEGLPDDAVEEPEPELPPLHQEAFDAIERGDFEAAIEAYRRALVENPKDEFAQAGLAQVSLLHRTADVEPQRAREAAANDPQDLAAGLVVADLDVLGGMVDDAFARLLDLVRTHSGDERDAARQRLIELFAVVGLTDPRVNAARRDLTNALY